MSDKKIFNELKKIASKALVPFSNFHVAALFEKKDGSFFCGFNIENSSFPNTLCAERVAIFSALNNSIKLSDVKTIHVYSPDSKEYLSPCGGCRQTISEHINNNVEIRMYNNKGQYISEKFSDIFKYPINAKNIKGAK